MTEQLDVPPGDPDLSAAPVGITPAGSSPMAEARIEALRASVARLRELVATTSVADLTGPAYPTEWSIADVLSHLGSGAVIMQRRLDDAVAGLDTPDEFAAGVWDVWNTKSPAAQRDDALDADAGLLERIDSLTADEQEGLSFRMGPLTLDFDAFVGMRLNEHAFHTWDIQAAVDPSATLPADATALVVDNLELIARFTAKPTGAIATIAVTTTDPPRNFTVALAADSVTLSPSAASATADLRATSEAFARLVYGRLGAEHTPQDVQSPLLEELRRVFPGP